MHFPFCPIEIDSFANIASLFRQRNFHYISCRAFHDDSREETHFFYLVDLLPVLIPTCMRNQKNNLSGEVCKIDKPPSLSIKPLKN